MKIKPLLVPLFIVLFTSQAMSQEATESTIPWYCDMSIWGIFRFSGWSGVVAILMTVMYSIPMGIWGVWNADKRNTFINISDDICKLLIAIFLIFTARVVIHQFYPSYGLDDRSFYITDKITAIASSGFLIFIAVAITRLIKILHMNRK